MIEKDLTSFKINKVNQNNLKSSENICNQLLQGKQVKDLLGFSLATMEQFYQAGHALLSKKKYKQAVAAFTFLVTLDKEKANYWEGLGISLQYLHHYEEAIDAYEMAAIYNIEDPYPYFYLSKCLFAIHDRKSALDALEICLSYALEKSEYTKLREATLKAIDKLKNF